jgi:hypothetical protein
MAYFTLPVLRPHGDGGPRLRSTSSAPPRLAVTSIRGSTSPQPTGPPWALRRSDHWQTDIPLSGLANYLTKESAHGSPYQVLPVWNSTWKINETTYRNQVLLYNRVRGGWDLVYEYDYAATDAQQKTGWVGSWAPIVETFQPLYTNTSPMGALQTQIIAADATGNWAHGHFSRQQILRSAPTMWAFIRSSSTPIMHLR